MPGRLVHKYADIIAEAVKSDRPPEMSDF